MSAPQDPASTADFRSDTVTRPSPAMRRAMAEAEVGDDVLDGDPTVRRLEERVAALTGKHGALFVPSGTMANQVALGVWARPGDEAIVEREAHVVRWESGAAAALFGVQTVLLDGERGALDPSEVRRTIRSPYIHSPRTALLCLEQTHLGSGGSVVPLPRLRELAELARSAGVAVHLDGARLFNAVVASAIPAADWAACADSVSVCFSKGLGAPVGSAIAGDEAFLQAARVVRKRLGGWMRQAGILAAGALHALEHNVERLAEDHALARELARSLHGLPGLSCPPERVDTNIAFVQVDEAQAGMDAAALAERLSEEGILVEAFRPDALRFVTHLDVGRADLERLHQTLRAILD